MRDVINRFWSESNLPQSKTILALFHYVVSSMSKSIIAKSIIAKSIVANNLVNI